jgi:hypothetical protein
MRAIRIVPDDVGAGLCVLRGEAESAAAAEILRMRGARSVQEEEVELVAFPCGGVLLHMPRAGRRHIVEPEIDAVQPPFTIERCLQLGDPLRIIVPRDDLRLRVQSPEARRLPGAELRDAARLCSPEQIAQGALLLHVHLELLQIDHGKKGVASTVTYSPRRYFSSFHCDSAGRPVKRAVSRRSMAVGEYFRSSVIFSRPDCAGDCRGCVEKAGMQAAEPRLFPRKGLVQPCRSDLS